MTKINIAETKNTVSKDSRAMFSPSFSTITLSVSITSAVGWDIKGKDGSVIRQRHHRYTHSSRTNSNVTITVFLSLSALNDARIMTNPTQLGSAVCLFRCQIRTWIHSFPMGVRLIPAALNCFRAISFFLFTLNICAKNGKPRHDWHAFHRAGVLGRESKVE